MEKKTMRIIVIALVILAMFLIAKNCKLYTKQGKLKGEIALRDDLIKEGGKHLEASDKALRGAEKAHSKQITALNGHIDSANTVIARLEDDDARKAERIRELEEELPKPSTAAEEIEYWKTWGEEWKGRFSLCSQVVGQKDEIVFSLRARVSAESQLRLQVDDSLSGYKTQVSLLETQLQSTASLVASLERKLRVNKVLKTGAGVGLACLVAYVVLKK